MRQFISGDDAAFTALERLARESCVRFSHEELPPGCLPGHADVGFEIQTADGAAILYVQRGIAYRGQDRRIREWLASGQMTFRTFSALRNWLRQDLARAFGPSNLRTPDDSDSDPARDPAHEPRAESGADLEAELNPETLTSLEAVRTKLRDRTPRRAALDERRLARELLRRVRGQESPILAMSRYVTAHVSKPHPRRPACLLLLGPTGVGKTRTAEQLPEALRKVLPADRPYGYLRLDMNLYQEEFRVSQLLGSPQGYVGYGDGAQLPDALSDNPRTIVLFDEIEKAHPTIFQTLMNAMDTGRLSVARGAGNQGSSARDIDCREAIFLFTSNLECDRILDELESKRAFGQQGVVDAVCRSRMVRSGLRPEIVGRIGRFLVYRPLDSGTRGEIATMAVHRAGQEFGLQVVEVAPEVVVSVLERTRDAAFGARPDEYVIEEMLGPAFARAVEEGITGRVVVSGPPFRVAAAGEPAARPFVVKLRRDA